MNCPLCRARTRVKNSVKSQTGVIRKRICKACGFQFYTEERENHAAKYLLAPLRAEQKKIKKSGGVENEPKG